MDTNSLKTLLLSQPLSVSVYADSKWQSYTSGDLFSSSTTSNNHAVLLVGFTSDYWIIRNSWGTNWGVSGDGFIPIDKSDKPDSGIKKTVWTATPA